MIYLPSISADYEQIFIYEIEDNSIQWDDDENCWFIDFSDEDYSEEASVVVMKGDPNMYTFLKFETRQWYRTMRSAKRKMYRLLFKGK